MDITTILGVVSGISLIIVAIFMRMGGVGLKGFFDVSSMFITFGGAFAATLVNYPMKQVLGVFKIAQKVLTEKEEDPTKLINQFIYFTKIAHKQGILELEKELNKLDNEFLKRGVQLVVDGADQERIRSELETEITFIRERHLIGQEIFVTLGTYCPAFGMIGTIMGLIMMLARIEDQSQIAGGMAVALLTTFYGAVAGYLFFLPISGKLKRRSEDEIFIKEVIIRGVLSLQSGEIPSVMEAKLKAYLAPQLRKRAAGEKITPMERTA
ncbi:MAG: motility protein A [Elusimicrobiota bacterium]|nr:motility protein A [Elusimicrobiota bacterium]MDH5661848.1 motility protein A [Elusimicrobiota bacterium]